MPKFNPSLIIVFSFFLVILAGAILLSLPLSSADGSPTNFVDSYFTSNSATCVTGLVTLDTGSYFSLFGKLVILGLIQIGGLGYMTFSTFLMLTLRRKMFISEKLMMQEALNIYSMRDVVMVLKRIFKIVFVIEGIGAAILFIRWFPEFGLRRAAFYSVFHSVSAFCNAGFALPLNYASMSQYVTDPVVNLVTTTLVIIGGIGFIVIADVLQGRKMSLHSKVAISATLFLILAGTAMFFALERANPATLGGLSFPHKMMASYFHAVTPRTAGFHSLDVSRMYPVTLIFTVLMMFVGASPGGTGGGVKTTTFAIIIATIWATLRNFKDTILFRRRVPFQTVRRAFGVAMLALAVIFTVFFALIFVEKDKTMLSLFFETVSAFGTVGLSMGITPGLSAAGKLLIVLTMFVGRVGPLTLLVALTMGQKEHKIEYPKEGISIG